MTRLMESFLLTAAQCEEGKGFVPPASAKRLAFKAVSDGYGMMIGWGGRTSIFIISAKGREALKAEASL